MDFINVLADPVYVAKFQRLCGVEIVKPDTCDQETQTRLQSSDSEDNSEGPFPSKPCREINGNVVDDSSGDISAPAQFVPNEIDRHPAPKGQDCYGSDHGVPRETNSMKNANNSDNHVRQRFAGENGHLTADQNGHSEWTRGLSNSKDRTEINNFLNGVHSTGKYIVEPSCHHQSKGKGDILPCSEQDSSHEDEQPPVQTTGYTIKYKSLYYLAQFGAFLGNEEFYLTFFPFCIWNLDLLIVRQVSYLWCMVMYLGQAAKDFLRWPRPPCPPCIRIETHYLQEYSMPSTHAMAGTAIPLYMACLVVDRYQVPVWVAAILALSWYSVTCMSRLYLGVHTILDLLVGTVSAVVIFFTFLRYIEGYDLYMQTHPFAAPLLMTTAVALCTICYPSTHKDSSKGDAVQIVAAVAGCNIGCWFGYQIGVMHEPEVTKPFVIAMPTLFWAAMAVLRFVSGTALVGLVYVAMRWSTIRFFSYLHGLEVPDKKNPNVTTAYKFTTYFVVGFTISILIPLLHQQLGMHRPAMFFEVL